MFAFRTQGVRLLNTTPFCICVQEPISPQFFRGDGGFEKGLARDEFLVRSLHDNGVQHYILRTICFAHVQLQAHTTSPFLLVVCTSTHVTPALLSACLVACSFASASVTIVDRIAKWGRCASLQVYLAAAWKKVAVSNLLALCRRKQLL